MYNDRDYFERKYEYVEQMYEKHVEDYVLHLPCGADLIDYEVEEDEYLSHITFIFRLYEDITEDDLDNEYIELLDVELDGRTLKVIW